MKRWAKRCRSSSEYCTYPKNGRRRATTAYHMLSEHAYKLISAVCGFVVCCTSFFWINRWSTETMKTQIDNLFGGGGAGGVWSFHQHLHQVPEFDGWMAMTCLQNGTYFLVDCQEYVPICMYAPQIGEASFGQFYYRMILVSEKHGFTGRISIEILFQKHAQANRVWSFLQQTIALKVIACAWWTRCCEPGCLLSLGWSDLLLDLSALRPSPW